MVGIPDGQIVCKANRKASRTIWQVGLSVVVVPWVPEVFYSLSAEAAKVSREVARKNL